MKIQHCGQSLTEYSLVAVLVCLVSVIGIRLLGQTLTLGFGNMIPGPTPINTTGNFSQVAGTAEGHSLNQNSDQASEIVNGGVDEIVTASPNGQGAEAPGTVQTAGGLGNNEWQLQEYSNQLIAFAAKFKEESPELYNQIIALGQAGKTMGHSLTQYEGAPDRNTSHMQDAIYAMSAPPGSNVQMPSDISAEGQATLSSLSAYSEVWKNIRMSPEYNALSVEDQATIVRLAQSSLHVTKGVLDPNYTGKGKGGSVQNLVNNSEQIVQCGSGNQCN